MKSLTSSVISSAVLCSLLLGGCEAPPPQASFTFNSNNDRSVQFAIFATQILPASLDGDVDEAGEPIFDDAISELIIFAGNQPNLCEIVTEAVESGGTPPEFVALRGGLVRLRKFELESEGSGIVPGENFSGVEVFGARKREDNQAFAVIFDEKEAEGQVEDIDEGFLLANTRIRGSQEVNGTKGLADLRLRVETTEVCPALLELPLIPLVGLPLL